MSSSRASAGAKALLVLFGIMLGLALAEATLQGLRRSRDTDPVGSRGDWTGLRVVYAIGDSHTWGWNVHAQTQSLPARLEVALNDGDPRGDVRVHNLGFPGFNTAQALHRLRAKWAEHPPQVVVALAGFNDAWNPRDPEDHESRWVLPRLWRLARLNWSDAPSSGDVTEVVVVDGVPHSRDETGALVPVSDADAREDLRQGDAHREAVSRGLRALVDLCQARDVPLILQTYLSTQNERFRTASEAARSVAQATGTPLADHARWLEQHSLDPAPLLQPDGHPTAAGCEVMAQCLLAILRAEQLLPAASPTGTPPDTGSDAPWIRHGRVQRTEDGTWELALEGPPGRAWQVVVAHSQRPTDAPHPFDPRIRLADDTLFTHSQSVTYGVRGAFDDQGRATARLDPDQWPALDEGPFWAQAFLLDRYSQGLLAVSDPWEWGQAP